MYDHVQSKVLGEIIVEGALHVKFIAKNTTQAFRADVTGTTLTQIEGQLLNIRSIRKALAGLVPIYALKQMRSIFAAYPTWVTQQTRNDLHDILSFAVSIEELLLKDKNYLVQCERRIYERVFKKKPTVIHIAIPRVYDSKNQLETGHALYMTFTWHEKNIKITIVNIGYGVNFHQPSNSKYNQTDYCVAFLYDTTAKNAENHFNTYVRTALHIRYLEVKKANMRDKDPNAKADRMVQD